MASQHFFAFSDVVQGLGHFQAAPYGCSSLPVRPACTTQPQLISVPAMAEYAQDAALSGRIATLDGIRELPIWVFAGGQDTVVRPLVCKRASELYSLFSSRVALEEVDAAQHAYVTDDTCPSAVCNSCGFLGSPFLNVCEYDMAGKMLAHLYGGLNARVAAVEENFLAIEQSDYFPPDLTPEQLGMNIRGFAYVPASCRENPDGCSIHVMYHGCNSGIDTNVGDRIFRYWGGNGWAESNALMLLYPQAFGSNCWDWTGTQAGTTDPLHDTRDGMQINVVNRMVSALRSLVSSTTSASNNTSTTNTSW